MAIFPNLSLEREVQINDRTRLDGSKSFVSKDESAITVIEIEPELGAGFVDVTDSSSKNWFLDWEYSGTSRDVTVSVRVTTDGSPVTSTSTLSVLTPEDDNLFSGDQDLTAIEEEILKFLPKSRNSFLNVHRKSQELILSDLDERGIFNNDGSRITKDQILDIQEVKRWSTFLTLSVIYQDISNAVDDVFAQKSQFYKSKAFNHRDRAILRFDKDKDGTLDAGDQTKLRTIDMDRR